MAAAVERSVEDYGLPSQKAGVALAAQAVRLHGWGLSDADVWQWLVGLVGGETNHGRSSFTEQSPVRRFAQFLCDLYDDGDPKSERLAIDVARQARREAREGRSVGGRS